jgi:predicted transposase/invertase (TIGR01784 family)
MYVSIAEEYFTKIGIEKGIEQGRLEGKLEVALKLLARGVSPDIVAESADMPLKKIQELMNENHAKPL